jgi:GT2 family glycosyltransferase
MVDPEASMMETGPQSRISAGARDPNLLFGPEYYASECGIPYAHTAHWINFFGSVAEHIIRLLHPAKVLDAGCAIGMLVESLWDRGVEAWGIDISEYAISQVRRDMEPYCRAASLMDPIEGAYDLITCIEVLEHMPSEDAFKAARNLCSATDTILFSSTPNDFTVPTHINVRPPIYWLKLFGGLGFQPVLQYSCDNLIPHAMLLRRATCPPSQETLQLYADHVRAKVLLHQQIQRIDELSREHERKQEVKRQLAESVAQREAIEQTLATANASRDCERWKKLEEVAGIVRQLSAAEAALRASQSASEEAHRLALERMEREIDVMREGQRLAEAAAKRDAEWKSAIGSRLKAFEHKLAHNKRQRKELNSVFDRVDRAESSVEDLLTAVGDLRTGLAHSGARIESILRSRIWRTLRAGGGAVLKMTAVPRRLWGTIRHSDPRAHADLALVCDEPQENDGLRSGRIRVSGWAVSPAHIGRVEVSVDDAPPVRAKYGLPRPDVAAVFPEIPSAAHSGYLLDLDSSNLSNGVHTLTLTAWDQAVRWQQVTRALHIDHDRPEDGDRDQSYEGWIATFEQRDGAEIARRIEAVVDPPRVSIVTPVYRTKPEFLRRAIDSVLAQSYPHWELCIADDGSGSPELEAILRDYSRRDQRIKATFREQQGGISEASNSALELASGDWIGLLDHDDELSVDALLEVAEAIVAAPELDLIYSDEDKITEAGDRYDPFFKPDWSPDLLRSDNYICHFLVFRRKLLEKTGTFRPACDGSQDYDLLLRMTEVSRAIHHIPRVLYHWRSTPTSIASSQATKSYALAAAERALADHFDRTCPGAAIEAGLHRGWWRARYAIPNGTRVSILIPSGGDADALAANLESVRTKTTYTDYEIVVIDNSREGRIEQYVTGARMPALRYVDWRHKPFNFSAMNNAAARQCENPVLLFLNDDTSVIAPGWLTAMVELAIRPEIGAVGAKLLYPGGQIQHAGVIMGMFGCCGHAFRCLDGGKKHYFHFPDVIRNVSAVTGACLMTRAETFHTVGGFDEDKLPVAFQDVDFCLKLGRAGYRVLYTPHALLTHHESLSKTVHDLIPHPSEVAEMRARWGAVIAHDPFYSPNLSVDKENYSLRKQRPEKKRRAKKSRD